MSYNFANLGANWGMPEFGMSPTTIPSLTLDPMAPSPALPQNAYGIENLGNFNVAGDPAGGGMLDSLKGWGDSFFGTSKNPGWGNTAMGMGQGLMGAWLGMQQYGLAKQKLAESKRQFDTQYAAQRTLTNSQLEDRQRARVASNPGAYQSVGDYMKTNGVA